MFDDTPMICDDDNITHHTQRKSHAPDGAASATAPHVAPQINVWTHPIAIKPQLTLPTPPCPNDSPGHDGAGEAADDSPLRDAEAWRAAFEAAFAWALALAVLAADGRTPPARFLHLPVPAGGVCLGYALCAESGSEGAGKDLRDLAVLTLARAWGEACSAGLALAGAGGGNPRSSRCRRAGRRRAGQDDGRATHSRSDSS